MCLSSTIMIKGDEFTTSCKERKGQLLDTIKLPIWTAQILFIIFLINAVPKFMILNRGYTVWFFYLAMLYIPLGRPFFLRQFLILQGAGISVGWYTALFHDAFQRSPICFHALYSNMPSVMKAAMFDPETGVLLHTAASLRMKCVSHLLDLVGHPGLTLLFVRGYLKDGGSLDGLLNWPVMLSAMGMARFWSVVHSYHNSGTYSPYYAGHEVYFVDSLNLYYVAYVGESLLFLSMIIWKLSRRQSIPRRAKHL